MKYSILKPAALICILLSVSCCKNVDLGSDYEDDGGTDTDADTDSDTDIDTDFPDIDVDSVDILLVVDNSSSMQEEQEILATRLFVLVNALVEPLPSSLHGGVDDVRVAVTTTDLGLSWGGNPYENGDGWPGGDPPGGCQQPSGDDGEFKGISVASIDIEDGVIPCDGTAAQCPSGWTCSVSGSQDEGVCQAPGGDGSAQTCPSHTGPWLESDETSQDPDLSFKLACMAQQGIDGCGFEQPLRAGVRALSRSDQETFVRDNSLLAVLVVSDESDCSLKSNELFGEAEIQDTTANRVNIACGMHPEHLYTPQEIHQDLTQLKDNPDEVLFAAIVGVPMVSSCQGQGVGLGDCLDEPDMQLNAFQHTNNSWYFEDACTNGTVTEAKPGRRYVELANQHFGPMGYIYSICNSDWTPAMEEIGITINRLVNMN